MFVWQDPDTVCGIVEVHAFFHSDPTSFQSPPTPPTRTTVGHNLRWFIITFFQLKFRQRKKFVTQFGRWITNYTKQNCDASDRTIYIINRFIVIIIRRWIGSLSVWKGERNDFHLIWCQFGRKIPEPAWGSSEHYRFSFGTKSDLHTAYLWTVRPAYSHLWRRSFISI